MLSCYFSAHDNKKAKYSFASAMHPQAVKPVSFSATPKQAASCVTQLTPQNKTVCVYRVVQNGLGCWTGKSERHITIGNTRCGVSKKHQMTAYDETFVCYPPCGSYLESTGRFQSCTVTPSPVYERALPLSLQGLGIFRRKNRHLLDFFGRV